MGQVEITQVPEDQDIPNETNNFQITQAQYIQLTQKLATIESALATKTTKEDLELVSGYTISTMLNNEKERTDFLLLASIISNICMIGILFFIYFWLKANRRLG